jgi:heme oxygenase
MKYHPLAERLRQATRALHTMVEHSPLMQRLLRGEMSRAEYCDWLCDLQHVYAALEGALAQHARQPQVQAVYAPALQRVGALDHDLQALAGPGWALRLQPSAAACDYADHLDQLSGRAPHLLTAHAYVRYLGDLSGGQTLARLVQRMLPGEAALAFYDFGGPLAVKAMASGFRAGLDRLATSESMAQAIVDEACAAFQRHGDWFAHREAGWPGAALAG